MNSFFTIRYEDGYAGSFYKTFDIRTINSTMIVDLLEDVIPYSIFESWTAGFIELYIMGFGKIYDNTPISLITEQINSPDLIIESHWRQPGMIDVDKCEYEESYYTPEEYTVHYFTYPKDLNIREFYPEEDYGNIFCMCLSLTRYDDGEYGLALSPTVEEDDCLMDVDWRDLYEGINYTQETINALLKKIKGDLNERH